MMAIGMCPCSPQFVQCGRLSKKNINTALRRARNAVQRRERLSNEPKRLLLKPPQKARLLLGNLRRARLLVLLPLLLPLLPMLQPPLPPLPQLHHGEPPLPKEKAEDIWMLLQVFLKLLLVIFLARARARLKAKTL
jgi:hypothetical protein